MTYPHTQLFINGQWCDAAAGESLAVFNPATGKEIGRVAHARIPDLPTLGESLPGFQFTVWTGLDAPTGTPRVVIDQVHDAVQKALASPAMKKLYLDTSRTPSALSSDQFAAFKAGEVQKYQKLSREAGIKAE